MCTTGGDIDVLCVVTNQITRHDFFKQFSTTLAEAGVSIDNVSDMFLS